MAERFAEVVAPFSAADLAKAARCTKEGAKHWKNGTRCPSLPKTLEMARSLPVVDAWLQAERHRGHDVGEFDCPRSLDAMLNALHYAATLPGPAGDQARTILAGKRS